jgi:hypothetical protein
MAVVDICLAMILTTEKTPPLLKKEEVKFESTLAMVEIETRLAQL